MKLKGKRKLYFMPRFNGITIPLIINEIDITVIRKKLVRKSIFLKLKYKIFENDKLL